MNPLAIVVWGDVKTVQLWDIVIPPAVKQVREANFGEAVDWFVRAHVAHLESDPEQILIGGAPVPDGIGCELEVSS